MRASHGYQSLPHRAERSGVDDFSDGWSATSTWGGRIAGRVADARLAHRETGRPNCWRDRGHLRRRLAGKIYPHRECVGRGRARRAPPLPELWLAGRGKIEKEVEPRAVAGRGVNLHDGAHCLDQFPANTEA